MAGALIFLLILTLIFIAVLTFGVARFSEARKLKHQTVAKYAAETGIARMILALGRKRLEVPYTHDGTLDNGASFHATVQPWGGYLLVRSVGTFVNQHVSVAAQVGSDPAEILRAALSVGDSRYPVVLTRGSRIRGNINAGPLGVTTGSMAGMGVDIDSAFFGHAYRRSDLFVPSIDSMTVGWEELTLESSASASQVLVGAQFWCGKPIVELAREESIYIDGTLKMDGSWKGGPDQIPRVTASGSIDISGATTLAGFVVLSSKTCIKVGDSTSLDGVLLVAQDSIIFEDHCRFSGTAVTRGQIIIRDSAQSRFPAALVTLPSTGPRPSVEGISLSSQSTLEGVCYTTTSAEEIGDTLAMLSCAETVRFTGQLVSQGRADISGVVVGSIWMQQSYHEDPPTTYVNWISELSIDRVGLRYEMPMPFSKISGAQMTIVRMESEL